MVSSGQVSPAFSRVFCKGALVSGRYQLEDVVGLGGFAQVWRAHDRKDRRAVALKVLFNTSADQALARFEQEWKILRQSPTTATIQVYSRGDYHGFPFLVMEYLPGRDLAREIKARGRLPADEVVALSHSVASTLHLLHQNGISHRDIKPANIYIEELSFEDSRRVRLLDLGIAKDLSEGESPLATQQHIYLGTPFYSAPEAYYQGAVPASDIYSLACVCFYALTGERPFGGHRGNLGLNEWKSLAIRAHLTGLIPSVADYIEDIPSELSKLLEVMMDKQPHKRPAAKTVSGAFERIAGQYYGGVLELSAGTIYDAVAAPARSHSAPDTEAESLVFWAESSSELSEGSLDAELRKIVSGPHQVACSKSSAQEPGHPEALGIEQLWSELSFSSNLPSLELPPVSVSPSESRALSEKLSEASGPSVAVSLPTGAVVKAPALAVLPSEAETSRSPVPQQKTEKLAAPAKPTVSLFASAAAPVISTESSRLPRLNPRSNSRRLWGLGAGLLLLTSLLFVGYRYLFMPAEVVVAAALHIESNPAGAQIVIDGKAIDQQTPYAASNYRDNEFLTISVAKEGYRPEPKEVLVEVLGTPDQRVDFDLIPCRKISVKTNPPGASVRLAGEKLADKTPLTLPRLDVGSEHQLEIDLEGYMPAKSLLEIAKDSTSLSIDLAAAETIQVETIPSGATIKVNGESQGVSPAHSLRVPANSYLTIEAEKAGYKKFRRRLKIDGPRAFLFRLKQQSIGALALSREQRSQWQQLRREKNTLHAQLSIYRSRVRGAEARLEALLDSSGATIKARAQATRTLEVLREKLRRLEEQYYDAEQALSALESELLQEGTP